MVARIQLPTVPVEQSKMRNPRLLQGKFECSREHSETVSDRAAEIDRRRLGKVPRRARYLADAKTKENGLCHNFGIEHEIVGILEKRQAKESVPGKRSEA